MWARLITGDAMINILIENIIDKYTYICALEWLILGEMKRVLCQWRWRQQTEWILSRHHLRWFSQSKIQRIPLLFFLLLLVIDVDWYDLLAVYRLVNQFSNDDKRWNSNTDRWMKLIKHFPERWFFMREEHSCTTAYRWNNLIMWCSTFRTHMNVFLILFHTYSYWKSLIKKYLWCVRFVTEIEPMAKTLTIAKLKFNQEETNSINFDHNWMKRFQEKANNRSLMHGLSHCQKDWSFQSFSYCFRLNCWFRRLTIAHIKIETSMPQHISK